MFDQKQILTKDAPLNDSIPFEGNTIFLNRKDPYGFIYLSLAKGELPKKYQGGYTIKDMAVFDANRFIQEYTELKEAIKKIKK